MELRSPIRLYWDITPIPVPPPDYSRLCAEIASSRALTLNITDTGHSLDSSTHDVLSLLADSSLSISLTVSLSALDDAVLLLAEVLVRKLFVEISTIEELAIFGDMLKGGKSSFPVGLSWKVVPRNFEALSSLPAWCIEHGISELLLPMERLVTGDEPLCLQPAQRESLKEKIAEVPFEGKLSVTVHDPFLWRVFFPAAPFPGGVCQAANTMLYIDPKGDIYPCPAMPIRLGSLIDLSFKELVASEIKSDARKHIISLPSGCNACDIQAECRGGCRGRGYALTSDWEDADPGCGIKE